MNDLESYYNKFNEDKRLSSRHGKVEFYTSMHYIHRYLEKILSQRKSQTDSSFSKEMPDHSFSEEILHDNSFSKEMHDNSFSEETLRSHSFPKSEVHILDIGAATGRYSIPLAEEGYDVTAVEPVKHNLGRLKQKSGQVHAFLGNALKLKRFSDASFDVTLLFGPMYHLKTEEEKIQALSEAARVTKQGGFLFVAYIMNEYSFLTYAIKERHIKEALTNGSLDERFHTTELANPLYSFVRLEDIDRFNDAVKLKRLQIIAADGAADYIRRELNALDEEEFQAFLQYHLSTCERAELIGASAHTVDILQKQ